MELLLLLWLMVSQDLESNSLPLLLSKILSTRTLWPELTLIFLLIGDATIAVSMSITWPPGVAMVWDGQRSLTFLGLPPEGVMEIPLLVSCRVNAGLWNALRLVSSRNRDFLCKRKRHRLVHINIIMTCNFHKSSDQFGQGKVASSNPVLENRIIRKNLLHEKHAVSWEIQVLHLH